MGHNEDKILKMVRETGSVAPLQIMERLKITSQSAWDSLESLEHKQLLKYDGTLRLWKLPLPIGSKYHQWDVSRGTRSFKPGRRYK